jgi:hypothetical protein
VSNYPAPCLLTYPLPGSLPKTLGPVPHPPTPELQHIVSRAVTPETLATNRLASYSGPALPHLITLASLTDQAPPSSPPSNALGLTFEPADRLSPHLPLPTHDLQLGALPSSFDPEDLTLCNKWDLSSASFIEEDDLDAPTTSRILVQPITDQTPIELPSRPDSPFPPLLRQQASLSAHTFGALSPPYIVRSPSPDPPVGIAHPHTAPPHSPTDTPAPQEEECIHNQENYPPAPSQPSRDNPRPPAPCTQDPDQSHPHQYFLVHHSNRDQWRPLADTCLPSLLNFVSQDELLAAPPDFPTVVPFKGQNNHIAHFAPTDLFQASLLCIPPSPHQEKRFPTVEWCILGN